MFAKTSQLAQAHGLHKAIGEVFTGRIADTPVGIVFAQSGVDALKQMRLARADRSMQHQWVAAFSRRFDHAQGGSMGHAVARANDKVAELVPAALRFCS